MKKDIERKHIVLSQINKEILSNKIVYFDWKAQTVTTTTPDCRTKIQIFKGGVSNFMTLFPQFTQSKAI